MMSESKKTKAEVHYRNGNARERCGKCTMFRPRLREKESNSCTDVEGAIGAFDVCDIYEPKKTTGAVIE